MTEKKISLNELQEKIGFDKNLKSRLNNGGYISLETVDKMCKVLEVPVEGIIEYQAGEQECKPENKILVNWSKVMKIAKEKKLSAYHISRECHQCVSYISKMKKANAALPKRVFEVLIKVLECKREDIEL